MAPIKLALVAHSRHPIRFCWFGNYFSIEIWKFILFCFVLFYFSKDQNPFDDATEESTLNDASLCFNAKCMFASAMPSVFPTFIWTISRTIFLLINLGFRHLNSLYDFYGTELDVKIMLVYVQPRQLISRLMGCHRIVWMRSERDEAVGKNTKKP